MKITVELFFHSKSNCHEMDAITVTVFIKRDSGKSKMIGKFGSRSKAGLNQAISKQDTGQTRHRLITGIMGESRQGQT